MKKITITLDERIAAWARAYAVKHKTSISHLVREMLQRRMGELDEYQQAMVRFLASAPAKLKRPGEGYPKREHLYDHVTKHSCTRATPVSGKTKSQG